MLSSAPGPIPGAGRRPGLALVGVGPGDPELLTVAALRSLEDATVVAYPVAREGAEGMAAAIAAPWLRPEQSRLPLVFPMVAEAEPRQRAWREAADQLAALVAAGESVVLLCEGDVSLYASCSYVLLAMRQRHPHCPVRLIPGITAVSAAAAAGAWPLVMQQEGLRILPTPEEPDRLEVLLEESARDGQVLALLKLGHRWRWVRPMLEQRQLLEGALFARRVGWPDQCIGSAGTVAAEEQPYFSLLLIRSGCSVVLP